MPISDYSIIGKKFGRLTVISFHSKGKNSRWLCRCDCGKEKIIPRNYFSSGFTKSCGCLNLEKIIKKDLLGRKFGRLTVISFYKQANSCLWLCRCDCGKEKICKRRNLLLSESISCGCYKRELSKKRYATHGKIKTQSYRSWKAMKSRCLNKGNRFYKNWGGRGIKICERWVSSFENFYEDMGDCPKGMSIERIDNDKDYFKENCKWILRSDQSKNRRQNIYLNYLGEKVTAKEYWRRSGDKGCYAAFLNRLKRRDRKMNIEQWRFS